MNLKCESSWCGYEIEWSYASRPENADMLGRNGCPECAGTLVPMLTDDMRLTMLYHLINSTVVPYGDSFVTTWDRWRDMRIPLRQILGEIKPLSAPPYTPEEFEVMRAVMSGRFDQ